MRRCIAVYLASLFLFACGAGKKEVNPDYIKIIVFGEANTVTAYNKGISATTFVYYEPQNDSLLYSNFLRYDSTSTIKFSARFGDVKLKDSFCSVVDIILSIDKPDVRDSSLDKSKFSCYFEYRRNGQLGYYPYYDGDSSDLLSPFWRLFNRLSVRPLQHKQVSNVFIDLDEEAVLAKKRMGMYDYLESPYIVATCPAIVDTSKIFGKWRGIDEYFNHQEIFTRMTILKNGTYFFEKVNGKDVKRMGEVNRFRIRPGNVFESNSHGKKFQHPIVQVSDSCFVVLVRGRPHSFNRL